jgi:hypothetical protein
MERKIFSRQPLHNEPIEKEMKLGLILECPINGTDQQVYEYVIKKLCSTRIEIKTIGSTNKKDLINACGDKAKLLLDADCCDHVVILWDLMPLWGNKSACRCLKISVATNFYFNVVLLFYLINQDNSCYDNEENVERK